MHNASKFAANMDDYLMRLGLCRKSVVRDSSCLFRIISEQVYFTQALHSTVQKKCLEYLCNHRDELLNEPPIHCEMMALSKIFKIDILIFQSPDEKPVDVTRNGYSKLVLLCHVDGIHYDMVYTQSHIHGLAISQSIIYEVLYRGVFELDSELDEAVNFLRQQKKTSRENSLNESDHNATCTSSSSPSHEYELSQKITLRLTPPLPYRIAKALDSTLYRNVAKDIVEEEKREAKLRFQNCGFSPGDKCQVVLSSQPSKAYNAFIQELSDNQGPVVVFLEELGEKRTVPYISLRHFPASRNGCQYSLSEGGYIPYIDRKKNKKKPVMLITDTNSHQNNYQNNYHNNRRYSSPRHWIQSGVKTMQLPAHQIDYNTSVNLDVNTQYCPVTTPPAIMSNTSLPVTNPPTYYMPVLNVPYPPNLGQVNLSQDPYGKDLPQDVNTLRYFYNFGVEASVNNIGVNQGSCRMMSTVMQQQTMAYPPTMIPSDGQTHMIMPAPVEHGQFVPSDNKYNSNFPQLNPNNSSVRKSVTINVCSENMSPGKDSSIKTNKTDTSDTVVETVEDNSRIVSPGKLDSPGSDSGLDSTTSSTEDHSTTYTVDTGHNKVKGKKKYYMYGNLKLVKPIKDIPPRFQMLLAETSAAKARCEGQPIYQQVPENHMLEHDTELNANARCFVPMQSIPVPCTFASGVGVNANASMALPNACYPPPNVLGSAPPAVNSKPPGQPNTPTVQPNLIPSVQSNGGGTCYYIYSSTGYSSLPPTLPTPTTTTPAGTSPATTVPPPQPLVYMMNSPYPPNQPCTYPTLQPVHGYGMCSATAQ